MKYLALFRPPVSLIDSLSRESEIKLNSRGIHCTLLNFSIDEEDESRLVKSLDGIQSRSFGLEIVGETNFNPETRALLLSRPEALLALHRQIVDVVRPFDIDNHLSDPSARMYILDKYNPHIMLSGVGIQRLRKNYVGTRMTISNYHLAKKKNGAWLDVRAFPLQD